MACANVWLANVHAANGDSEPPPDLEIAEWIQYRSSSLKVLVNPISYLLMRKTVSIRKDSRENRKSIE
jgi:hypothetical protein